MKINSLLLIALQSVCLIFSGCSLSTSSSSIADSSESSTSISTSINNSSESISTSSQSLFGKGEESVEKVADSYQEDISTLSVIYVDSAGSARDFQRELGHISSGHGVIDWENNVATFKAIGRGLRFAQVSEDSINGLLFLQGLSGSPHYSEILAGLR